MPKPMSLKETEELRSRKNVKLSERHILALLAFGEVAFGPAELCDDHDEALEILKKALKRG